jgi:hypothetical protein
LISAGTAAKLTFFVDEPRQIRSIPGRNFITFTGMKLCVTLWFLVIYGSAGAVPFVFTENKGQVLDSRGRQRPDVLYYADCAQGRLYFFSSHISVVKYTRAGGRSTIIQGSRSDFQLGCSSASLVAEQRLSGCNNYYLSHCPSGISSVAQYRALVYRNYSPGTDLVVSAASGGQLEFNFREHEAQEAEPQQSACAAWSTYYGGSSTDEAWGITGDANNNTYTAGYTLSADFPVSPGAFQDTVAGFYDGVVIKMDSCGNRVWTTFVGSSGNDFAEKICMNGSRIVVVGHTTGNDLPVGNNPWQAMNNGGYDAFVFRFDENGARIWGTYFGGSGGELGLAVASDSSGNIFFGGSTSSANLPVQNAFQPGANGALEAYVTKLDSMGQRLWCTYYGGSGSEDVHGMATDAAGNIVVCGGSFSTNLNVSAGAWQPQNNGFSDGYILKLDPGGSRVFSTYFGGNDKEDINGVCTDAQGNIYLSGVTASSDLPATPGAFQSNNGGGDDMFIAGFDASGVLGWCTYFGGLGNETAYAIATDGAAHFFVLGISGGTDTPVIGTAPQPASAGGADAFLLKISAPGQVLWSTFYGGSQDETAAHLHVDALMHVFITGNTGSTNFPVSASAWQAVSNGPEDIFIARLDGSFDTTTGVAPNAARTEVIAYPNPSNEAFCFAAGSEISSVAVYDQLGHCVDKLVLSPGSRKLPYHASHLPAGIYHAVLATRTGLQTVKITKTP